MSNVNMEATTILPMLKKKLAFLSGETHTDSTTCTGAGLQVFIGCLPCVCDSVFVQGGKTDAAA